ncbi:MAG: site-specific integrase [Acidimicrobiales bacterium]
MADGARTVADVVRAYVAHLAALGSSPKTLDERRRMAGRISQDPLGSIPIQRLGVKDLDDYYGRLIQAGLKRSTVRGYYSLIRAAGNKAVDWGWTVSRPWSRAKPPPAEDRRPSPPAAEAVRELLAAADPQMRVFVRLAATVGSRRGELCALRWNQVDWESGTVRINDAVVVAKGAGVVHRGATKTTEVPVVALGPATQNLLREWRGRREAVAAELGNTFDESSYVFSDDPLGRTPWRPDSTSRKFRRLCAKVGLTGVRLHDLRHFVGTEGVDRSNIKVVQQRLGHRDLRTTLGIYAARRDAADVRLAHDLDELLGEGD